MVLKDNIPEQGRAKRWILGLGCIAVAAMIFAGAYFVDPAKSPYLPECQLHRLTGLYCAGCGATRATHQLAHGRILAALHLNAAVTSVLLALPLVACVLWLMRKKEPVAWQWKVKVTLTLLGAWLLFGALRNLPVYPFTLLAPVEPGAASVQTAPVGWTMLAGMIIVTLLIIGLFALAFKVIVKFASGPNASLRTFINGG
jgi:hypothetical protein